jgi:hypothetical protein
MPALFPSLRNDNVCVKVATLTHTINEQINILYSGRVGWQVHVDDSERADKASVCWR